MAGEIPIGTPPGWGEVIGVWYDIVDGRPVLDVIMLPGARKGLALGFAVFMDAFLLLVGENQDDISLEPEEFLDLLEKGNIPFGLFAADLKKGTTLKHVYNWYLKALRAGGFLERFTVVGLDSTPITQVEVDHTLSEAEAEGYRELLDLLKKEYGRRLKKFKEIDSCSLELYMLGPSYLANPTPP